MPKTRKPPLSEAFHWRVFHKARSSNLTRRGENRPECITFMFRYMIDGTPANRPTERTGEVSDHHKASPSELIDQCVNMLGQSQYDGRETFKALTKAFNEISKVEKDLKKLLKWTKKKKNKGKKITSVPKFKRASTHRNPDAIEAILESLPKAKSDFAKGLLQSGLARTKDGQKLDLDDPIEGQIIFDDYETTRDRMRETYKNKIKEDVARTKGKKSKSRKKRVLTAQPTHLHVDGPDITPDK